MPKRPRILIVEEQPPGVVPLEAWLDHPRFRLTMAHGRGEAETALQGSAFDLILVMVSNRGGDPEWLSHIETLGLGAPLVLVGGKAASSGLASIVFDHLTAPVNRETCLKTVDLALEFRALSGRQHLLLQQLETVLAGVREPVLLVDEAQVVMMANSEARSLCGFPVPATGGPVLLRNLDGWGPPLTELFMTVKGDGRSLRQPVRVDKRPGETPEEHLVWAAPMQGNAGRFAGAVLVIQGSGEGPRADPAPKKRGRFHRLIGASTGMTEVYSLIEDVASLDTTILITGESGTGKELVAEAIHYQSKRNGGPLVKVNCSGLAESLLEDELFGHVKGAFTGAVRPRMGRFQLADGGTIFLDEIGDVSPAMQTRLLRTLQEREFEPVGDSRTIKVDVRIVAATNQDLSRKIREGAFREDLFFRLKVVEIKLPPLRERDQDIELLTDHFLHKFNAKYGRSVNEVHETVQEIFRHHLWPGNVRELENVVEHAYAVCHGSTIRVKHLPKEFLKTKMPCGERHQPTERGGGHSPRRQQEREAILEALETTHWHKMEAARLLGISRSSLYRKMNELDIQ
ncbi:MAG: sigma 54-interacting transcriptional regulator [Magnetococcales bacterium]|nr:sigma 54-interacting transcriptional regulator [Magnetococcales bacterium]